MVTLRLTPPRNSTLAAALIALVIASSAYAEDGVAASRSQARSLTPIWTIAGAGAGFGLGVWVGLTAFDDSINSDRKVWTTAILSAAAGGILGYLVDRHRGRTGASPAQKPATVIAPREEQQIVADARDLGSGKLKHWTALRP